MRLVRADDTAGTTQADRDTLPRAGSTHRVSHEGALQWLWQTSRSMRAATESLSRQTCVVGTRTALETEDQTEEPIRRRDSGKPDFTAFDSADQTI